MQIFKAAFVFTLLHELIGSIFIIRYGNIQILLSHGWIWGSIFQILSGIVFYFNGFMVQELFGSRLKGIKAELVTVVLFLISYFVFYTISGPNGWSPFQDSAPLYMLCAGKKSTGQCILSLLRLVICAVVLVYLFYIYVGQGDVFDDEEKE